MQRCGAVLHLRRYITIAGAGIENPSVLDAERNRPKRSDELQRETKRLLPQSVDADFERRMHAGLELVFAKVNHRAFTGRMFNGIGVFLQLARGAPSLREHFEEVDVERL